MTLRIFKSGALALLLAACAGDPNTPEADGLGNRAGTSGAGDPNRPIAGIGGGAGKDPEPGPASPRGGSANEPGTMNSPAAGGQAVDWGKPQSELAQCDTPGPRLIRRLTAQQYDNTLKSLVGDEVPVEVVLSDPAVNGFHVDADAPLVSDLTAELLMGNAERISDWVLQNQAWRVATCNSHDASCHREVVTKFGRRAFRQELTEQQASSYMQLFAAEETFKAGLHVVLTTMLQSPYLLYRRELGEPDPQQPGQYRLTPFEIASELSYFMTDSPPNEQLLNEAAEGRLSTQEGIDQALLSLSYQDSAKTVFARFVHGWLEVDNLYKKAKDPSVLELTDTLREAMLGETKHFFIELFQRGGTISDLYGADFTMLNKPLAEHYGFGGVSSDTFARVPLEGRRATGILGHAAFLTEHALPENSSPVQRGVVVRERLLCQDLPPVPAALNTNLKEPTGFANNRERYAQHSSNPQCVTCHQSIDPVGFAFEQYDAFGRFREQDMGSPVDASGELSNVTGGPIALDGLQPLSDYLSKSDEARSCFIRYWSYYAHGREGWSQQECNHDAIRAEAAANGYDLQKTLLAIVHAPNFTRRVQDR